jgi:hypothetical protein
MSGAPIRSALLALTVRIVLSAQHQGPIPSKRKGLGAAEGDLEPLRRSGRKGPPMAAVRLGRPVLYVFPGRIGVRFLSRHFILRWPPALPTRAGCVFSTRLVVSTGALEGGHKGRPRLPTFVLAAVRRNRQSKNETPR